MNSLDVQTTSWFRFAAAVVVLHASVDICLAEQGHEPGAIPTELNMVINPGTSNSSSIRFQTSDPEQAAAKEQAKPPALIGVRKPYRKRDMQPTGSVRNTVKVRPLSVKGAPVTKTRTMNRQTTRQPALIGVRQEQFLPPASNKRKERVPEQVHVQEQVEVHASLPQYLEYRPDFTLSAGYRNDSLRFTIPGPGGQPNILSELTWEDIHSAAFGGDFRWSNSSGIYLRGRGDFGVVVSGENQDSDYNGDNRTMEFSRSYSDTSDGSLLDASIGVGYRFDIPWTADGGKFHIMPLLGYSYHAQEFQMTDGNQVIAAYQFEDFPLGPFDGLHSRYDTKWSGPWLGVDMEMWFNPHHALLASFAYHWVDYEADAQWNLRQDFNQPLSFQHNADGEGYRLSLNYRYTAENNWFYTIGATYQSMDTEAGEYLLYTAGGNNGAGTWHLDFNEAEWESFSITAGVGYSF